MNLRFKYIGLFLGLQLVASQSWGQGQSASEEHWLLGVKEEYSIEKEMVASIEKLQRAKAGIENASTVSQLDSIGYLTIAQSGFRGAASDNNQRKGWWLLSYPVAVKYGLVINGIIDERQDLVKSTQAAFSYWQDLMHQYGSAEMADMVFSESPIAVAKYTSDSLNFPNKYKEFVSTKDEFKNIKNLFIANKANHPVGPAESVEQVTSNAPISFEVLHHYLQISTAELTELNSQWVAGIYDPTYGMLNIPTAVASTFHDKQKEMEQKTRDDEILLAAANEKRVKALKGNIPDLNTYKPISYKVKMGDNLGRIAQRHHVRISDLRAWNGLRSDRIYAGQRMTIYIPKNQQYVASAPVAEKKPTPKPFDGNYEEYTVQQGDTLWAISQKYGHVSIENIMSDNGIDENISPGQVIKIRKQ